MLEILASPFKYIKIIRDDKYVLDWLLPVLFSIATTLLFSCSENYFPVILDFGRGLSSFVSTLPGFYIAALTAVVTFSNNSLDEVIAGTPPRLKVLIGGQPNIVPLTRRKFIAHLFSFLSIESILICLFCLLFPFFMSICEGAFVFGPVVALILVTALSFLLWQLIFITVFGVYYIGDRILSPTL